MIPPSAHTLAAQGGAVLFGTALEPMATDAAAVARAVDRLRTAQRPMVIAGGPGWDDAAAESLRLFAQAHTLPVCCRGRYRDIIDHECGGFAGCVDDDRDPALSARLAAADLLLLIGADDSGIETGAERIALPVGAVADFPSPSPEAPDRNLWRALANTEAVAWSQPPAGGGRALEIGRVLGWLRDRLPLDAVVTTEADGPSAGVARHLLFRRPGRYVAGVDGAGFAVAAAVAARMVHPKRAVLGFTDAAGLSAAADALAEAAEAGAAPVVIAINDAQAPDIAETAQARGAFAVTVERTRDFVQAFWDAMWSGRVAVIELRVN